MKISLALAAALPLVAGVAFAAPPASSTYNSPSQTQSPQSQNTYNTGSQNQMMSTGNCAKNLPSFSKLDKNNTGYLSTKEAGNVPNLQTSWQSADSNNDGKVSRQEYDSWKRQQKQNCPH